MRHTRKNKRGGVGFGDIGNFFSGKTNPPTVQSPQGQDQMQNPMQSAPMQDDQMQNPMQDQGAPMQSAPMPAEGQAEPVQGEGQDNSSGDSMIDQKVTEILGLKGYHMRAIINAISACNSTMKMQNNAAGVGNSLLNAVGRGNESKLEMRKCGSQCKERSETVKKALRDLLDTAGNTDVLGFIASGTGAINTAKYLGNSGVSLANRSATQASQAASSVGNAATNAVSSVGSFFSGLTRKATQPQVNGQPTVGGRRRRRTRRR